MLENTGEILLKEMQGFSFKVMLKLPNVKRALVVKEGNVSFNDAHNTFYLRLYGVRHMVTDRERQRDREREYIKQIYII